MGIRKTFFISVILIFFLSGCWDNVDIEDRAFLAGIAVDLAEEGEQLEMTEQSVVPAGLSTSTGGGSGKAYRNLSDVGETLQNIHSKLSLQSNRLPNIEHLGFILISREIAEKEEMMGDILDVFIRQPGMRRGIQLAIADGKAKDFLDVEPEHVKIPTEYLSELTDNRSSSTTVVPIRLGDIQEWMLVKRSYIIPLLKIRDESSVEYSGLALFNGTTNQMVGVVQDDEAKGVQFIRGENEHGSVTTDVEGDKFSFLILGGKSKKKIMNKDKENLQFQVTIEINAAVAEYTGSRDLDKKEEVKRFEKIVNEEVKKRAEESIAVVKDEYQVDVFMFQDHIRMYQPDLWKEIKDNWDVGENYFSKSTITVEVKSNLIRPGSSATTE